ncbi:MAG TPA: HdeA/HdeB family chaperone [Beijerinckiaceae bacterium]|nr:HdeA/HdeB family chaperone [Beijerinckiaceae bacterium]
MRVVYVTLLAATLLTGSPATAQVLDLSTIKCKDFVSSSKETIGVILAWMHAYYKDEDDPPTIDFDKLAKEGEQLGAYCAANPEIGLITAADKLFDK